MASVSKEDAYNLVWNLIKTTWRNIYVYRLHRLLDQDNFVTLLDKYTLQLENLWKNANKKTYNQFVDAHIGELVQIRKLLTGKNRQIYFTKQYSTMLTLCNTRIFSNTFRIARINARFSRLPTEIFTEFIKGITFFKSDITSELEDPPYHQPPSCGSADETFINKFKITESMSMYPALINSRKRAVKLCYIERLIYNNIYTYVIDKQNTGHLVELYQLERLFQDYYPDHKLTIDTNIGINQFAPTFLLIIDSYDNNKFHIEETFQKEANGNVLCKRIVFRNNGQSSPFEVKKEIKTQSFATGEVPWSSGIKRVKSI